MLCVSRSSLLGAGLLYYVQLTYYIKRPIIGNIYWQYTIQVGNCGSSSYLCFLSTALASPAAGALTPPLCFTNTLQDKIVTFVILGPDLSPPLVKATVLRAGNPLTPEPLEVAVAVAQAGGVVAATPPAARVLVVVAWTRVHREGDVEAGHVVRHVAVEVE